MAQAYIRQSTFADGDTITAALFNDEYNQLVNAFAYSSSSASSTGHRHDGTAGQGGNIFKIGDLDFLNKIEVDGSNNRLGFYVEVSSAAVEQIRIQDGAIVPVTDSDIDLGTTSLRFKDTFTDSITTTGNVDVGGNLTVTGTTTFNGGTITMGDAATDNVVFGADVDSSIIPDDDDTYDLGSSSQQWRNIFIDGTAEIDTLALDGTTVTSTAAELNILDGVTSTAAELNILDGVTSTTAELNILDGVTSSTAELNILDGVTSTTAELNILDGVTSTAAELNILDGVTATATELNLLDGVTSTTAELNILDGVTSTTAELNILDGVTATATEINALDGITSTVSELNIVDGDTSATSTTLADADRVVVNDNGTMVQVALTDFETYFESALDTLSNVTTVGALNAGSITSGFGAIDNGSSAITTTGTVTYGSLSDGTITITAFVDEDDMSSNSATLVPTQQSVKAYVDTQLTAEDLDVTTDSGTIAIDLDSETLTIGGTSNEIETSATGNAVTIGIPAAAQITTSLGIGGGSTNGVQISQGAISIKNGGTQSYIDFYCESSNAHYARLQAPAHSAFSGNITLTLPATTGTLALTSGDITGNAATATALATARTIHGVSFDGTANIDLTEVIQDTVGAMVTGNTESNITVTYEDSDGTLDFSVTGGGSVSEAFKTISVSGQDDVVADSATDTLTLVAGSNMTITTNASGDTITFASSGSGGSQNLFSTIAVSGQSNVVADSTTDTLTLVAGSNITLTTDASSDSITIASSASGSGGSSSTFAKNTFTGDGSTTAFTLSTSMTNEDGLIVFIDGVYQADNVYSVSGTTLTFATAPVNSRVIEVFQLEGGIVGTAPSIDTMTGDGSDTTLSLSVTPTSENQTFVTIDGVVQHKDTYSVSGSTLTFSAAPPTGTKVECITFSNVSIATFQDADGDTKIQVEESTDEDTIRFDIAGAEDFTMTANSFNVLAGSKIDLNGTELILDDDGDTSITADTDDQIDFKTGGSDRVTIDSSGNVGVGITSPKTNLDIASATGAILTLTDTRTVATSGDLLGKINFYNSDASGDGAQNAAAIAAFHNGSIGNGGYITFSTTAGGTGSEGAEPSERMRIDAAGNIGIGTTTINSGTLGTSNTFLEVAAGTKSGSGTIILSRTTSGNDNEVGGLRFVNSDNADDDGLDSDGKLVAAISARSVTSDSNAGDDSGANLLFYTKPEAGNYAERMRIDSSGNLLVGQTSLNYNAVGASLASIGTFRAAVSGGLVAALNRKTSDGPVLNFYKDGTGIGTIGASGDDLVIGTGDTGIHFHDGVDSLIPWDISTESYRDNAIDLGTSSYRFDDIYASSGTVNSSDQNEKNTIAESDLGLDFVKKLSPKSYKFNGKTRTHYGLIAQDIETVLTDISKSTTDFAGFVKEDISEEQDGSNYRYGLRYNEFIAPLIKAIQEQQEQIEALQSEINTLKGE